MATECIYAPQRGWEWQDYPQELDFFLNLWSYSLPMRHKCVSKIPLMCLKIDTYFLLEFQSKVSKVPSLCQSVLSKSRGGSDFLLVLSCCSRNPEHYAESLNMGVQPLYTIYIAQGGLFAPCNPCHGSTQTLPVILWYSPCNPPVFPPKWMESQGAIKF